MVAAPTQKRIDYSMFTEKIKAKNIKGLCSSVIYGPNAAGKTNIIGSMDVFRSIVLRGNIRNSEEKTSPNPAAAVLELIHNNTLKKSEQDRKSTRLNASHIQKSRMPACD